MKNLPTIDELNAELEQPGKLPTIDELNAGIGQPEKLPTIEELNAGLVQQNRLPTIEELNGEAQPPKKDDPSIFARMKLEKEAQLGKEMGTAEAVASYLPVVGGAVTADANRQRYVEQRLMKGEVSDPTEMIKLAQSIGIDQKQIDELVSQADSGQRSIAGFKMGLNADVLKNGFSAIAKERFANRLKTQEEKQQRLASAEDLGILGEIAKGTLGAAGAIVEYANPITTWGTLGMEAVNRGAELQNGQWQLDENGNPVQVKAGDGSAASLAKGLAGATAEKAIWTGIAGRIAKIGGGKLLEKIPALNKVAGLAAKGVTGATEKVAAWMAKSDGGRLALKTMETIGKIDEKLHFGSLPNMIFKTRLTELADNVVGLNKPAGERESFGQWLENFVSVENNAELLTGIIGIHLLTAGFGAAKAYKANKEFRHGGGQKGQDYGREELVAEYIGAERAKKLSNQDLENIYELITSPDLTVEKATEFVDKLEADRAKAQEKIDAGESLESVLDGVAEKRAASTRAEEAARLVGEKLQKRAEISPEQHEALDAKIAEYAGGQEAIAKLVKADIEKNLKDTAAIDNPDMLEELVAMSTRKFNGEARRLKIHDLRGNKDVGAQMRGIEELGVSSWDEAEAQGLVTKDKYGRYGGGARRALNISLHGTDKLKEAVREGRIDGELAEDLLTAAQCELGNRTPEEQAALVDGVLDRANGDAALARRMLEKLEADAEVDRPGKLDERLDRIAEEAKAEAIRERNPTLSGEEARGAAVEPVETADGKITTVGETVDADGGTTSARQQGAEPKPMTALDGAENADRLAGTKLTVFNGATMSCNRFPEAKVRVSSDGVIVNGLTADALAKPENMADVAAFLTHVSRIAQKNGLKIIFDDADAANIAKSVLTEIREQGAEKTMNKLNLRSKLFELLFKTTLGNGVTYDEASFKAALEKTGNGRQFVDNHGDVYGFVDAEGVLHFNPAALKMDTPIHEYGHLALEATKKINNALWKRGNELVKESQYYRDLLAEIEQDPNSPYRNKDEEGLCDEALARLIGDRGAQLVEGKGVEGQLKEWLKSVWKAFKGALGVADLTEEQIEKMSLGEFVDTMNAELLKGGEFGTKKRTPPSQKSIKKYDETDGSGSNGLLRWKNDRGYLFAIPVDMERTQPGGRVVLATDDANVTDWIQNALHGYELRMSRTGKLFVKGRNGLDSELAEIFGRYPTIGQNDGIFEQVRAETGREVGITPDALVEALRKDRASYDAWKRGEDAEAQHWADEQAHDEWLAQQRWENSGMSVIDYVKSRIEEGAPEFDLDWETAREIERDRAEGRFAISPAAKQISETTKREFADDPVTSKWKIRVEPEAFRRLAPRPLKTVKPVTESTDNNSVKKAVKKLFVDFGKVHNADDGTDVSFNPNDAGKIMMQSGIDMRTFAPQLKSLFETSTLAFESPQEKFSGHKYRQNVDWFKYYVNKFVGPDGKEKYIRFTVRIENNWTKQGIHAATVSDVAVYENENAEGRTFRAHKLRGAFRGFTDFILSHYIGKGKGGQQTFKERQFEIVKKFNKAQDDVHAWIRSVDDIKTAREAFEADGAITDGFAPDAGPEVYAEALKTGKIKVYSSKPIENGNFVTPSRMEAKNYAGNGRIYEAVLPLDSIAWLDAGQGQVAKLDKVQGNQALFSVGNGRPIVNKSLFVAGRARVADPADWGEQTPGALAASSELSNQGVTPMSSYGAIRKMSLPLPLLEFLRKRMADSPLPAHVAGRMPGGKYASHSRNGQLYISADVFGTVDKTDMAKEKAFLKQHGFFRNEDPSWCAGQLPNDIAREKRRSEDQLATQLLNLGSRRVRGQEPGGQEAARKVFADEVAKYILRMPQSAPGVLGKMQTIGKALRAEIVRQYGGAAKDAQDKAKQEAGGFLDWAYGGPLVDPATGNPVSRGDALGLNDLSDSMFGAWLVMPQEMERRAPNWSASFESTIAAEPKLADAFREMTMLGSTEQATGYIMDKLRAQQKRSTEEALKQLWWESREPISTGSKVADAKETLLVGFHDKFAPVYVRVDEKVKNYVKAEKDLLKKTVSAVDRAAIRQEIDRFTGEVGRKMHKLELSRTAYERGAWNEGRRYFMQMALLENKATEKWGLSEEDKSLYLQLQRVIETQGKAGSFGMTARNAQIGLDEMKTRLGAAKFAKLEQYSQEFFSIHEREILADARIERALGKSFVDYCRTQTHYVTTKRTFSPEELDAIETARAAVKQAGVAGGDDVITQMYAYAGARGAGSVIGEGAWLGKLKGSMAATQEVRSATWEKVDPLMQFGRRNQMVLDLRDALVEAGVEGVRDMVRTDGTEFPSDPRGRYGHINYMENGQKRVLVVPRQISDAFRIDPDNAQWITKANGLVRSLLIDYNVAYWAQNVKRNQDSVEKNMQGMRETWLKTGLRGIAPGVAPIVDLVSQALVRKIPAVGHLFGQHTFFAHVPKAERYAKILENPTAWQQELWKAEAAGNVGKVQQMNDDFAGVMELLRGNFLVPTSAAYTGAETHGFAFDMMNKKGLKTLAQIEEENRTRSRGRKFVDKINVFKMNQAQQEHEDILAKTVAYLHDRANYAMQRSVAESGLMVKKNVSIAEGERSGRMKRGIQASMAQFFNMVEKGVVRHWKAVKERPGETLVKDGKVWIGRLVGMTFANGVLMKYMLDDDDVKGDEQKAIDKYGIVYRYAKAFHTAYQNCSDYVKENYNFTPLWNSADGMTSVIIGGALTDEDKLIVPSADLVSSWIAHRQGIGPKPEIGKAIANSTFKAVTPDLQLAAPIVNFLRATVEATMIDNPTDYFRNAPMYDEKLWRQRNESWEMRGKFAAQVGCRLWNDFGGRALLAANVNGVDNGRGSAPNTLEDVLRRIPVLSPAIARMIKIQVGSPAKKGAAITDRTQRTRDIINLLAQDLLKRGTPDVGWHESHLKEFQEKLADWKETYGLTDADLGELQKKYYNAWIQRRSRSAYDQKALGQLFKEGVKQGLTEEQIWIQLGER